MYYNIESFGKKMKEIRESLNISQKEIYEITSIDSKTIRRIESGKVLPKFDTLEILSVLYKKDLASLLLEYRFDDYLAFCDIKKRIELKLDNGEQHTLDIELEKLNTLFFSTDNPYCKNLIRQMISFTEALILYKTNDNKDNSVLEQLTQAIGITTSDFNLDYYDSYIYSSMEIRILMNIALVFNRLNECEKYLEIMKFCLNSINSDDDLYPKLCHNLAGVYRRNQNFEKALELSNSGIRSCQENGFLNGLSILYYGKGFAEHKLDKEESLNSLNLSISLCEAFGQANLKKFIIDSCRNILNIDII